MSSNVSAATSQSSPKSSPSPTSSSTRACRYDTTVQAPRHDNISLTLSFMCRRPSAQTHPHTHFLTQKLDSRLSSPNIRAARFQRFEREPTAVESYRRGPGSYTSPSGTESSSTSTGDVSVNHGNRSTEQQDTSAHTVITKPRSNFGYVKHRDLVRFMVAAGHMSDSCLEPTMDVSAPPDYLARLQSRSKTVHSAGDSSGSSGGPSVDGTELSKEELWRVMKQGPSSPDKHTSTRNRKT